MDIQWYPGHMAKTKRLLAENISLVDIIIELLDARIPTSSQNPEFEALFKNKKRIKAFNKSDLADSSISAEWNSYYEKMGIPCIFINSKTGKGFKEMLTEIESILKEKFERDERRGIKRRPIKAMVTGIPNVGKSTFINKLSGKSGTKTGDRPGVTKSKQWIRISSKIHLLDTPGILWPKFDDEKVGYNLAFTGAIKDEIMNTEELAKKLLERLNADYPENLKKRYSLDTENGEGNEILKSIAISRNYLIQHGEPDLHKTSLMILDEFRGGKIGNISLERP